jgi:type IV pilus assembly protein PilE
MGNFAMTVSGKMMRQTQAGFTLIELMITVAIVGILAAIAIPSYRDSVLKSRREDAKGALLGLANAMERRFTEVNNYCDAGGTGGTNTCGAAGTPRFYTVDTGTDLYYDITISAASAASYTLQAEPEGAQADDKCGILSLTNTGAKSFTGTGTVAECW